MTDEEFNERAKEIIAQNEAALAEERSQVLATKTAALKSLRVEINTAMAHAKTIADTLIQRGTGGRELSLCFTNLQFV